MTRTYKRWRGRRDRLVVTIEAIHTAGLDRDHWPDALAAVTQVCGGVASTLEIFDKTTHRHSEFHSFGVPAPHELTYVDHFLERNPRVAYGLQQDADDLGWDYQILDETAMNHDPFYAEFLPQMGFRYFVSGILKQTEREFSAIAVQRSPAQGHVSRNDLAIMKLLLPHLRQALEVSARLRHTESNTQSLREVFDRLTDGVALVAANGAVVHANSALEAIAGRGDVLRIAKTLLTFSTSETRARFALALAAATQLGDDDPAIKAVTDFAVPRRDGLPPCLISVRPLMRTKRSASIETDAVAMVFVRDPLGRNLAESEILREVFGFTNAEADLARALQAGASVNQYARGRAVSLNTVYTHLRRIKEKTNCTRMGELIQKLSELQLPLRRESP